MELRLDPRLSFRAQFEYAAAQTSVFLSRLMVNIGAPYYSKRELTIAMIQPILLYGCQIWADTPQAKYSRKIYATV